MNNKITSKVLYTPYYEPVNNFRRFGASNESSDHQRVYKRAKLTRKTDLKKNQNHFKEDYLSFSEPDEISPPQPHRKNQCD